MRVKISQIEWDTEVEGELHEVALPLEMIVAVDSGPDDSLEQIEDWALDAVSDRTGWCVLSSTITILKKGET